MTDSKCCTHIWRPNCIASGLQAHLIIIARQGRRRWYGWPCHFLRLSAAYAHINLHAFTPSHNSCMDVKSTDYTPPPRKCTCPLLPYHFFMGSAAPARGGCGRHWHTRHWPRRWRPLLELLCSEAESNTSAAMTSLWDRFDSSPMIYNFSDARKVIKL